MQTKNLYNLILIYDKDVYLALFVEKQLYTYGGGVRNAILAFHTYTYIGLTIKY